MPWVNALGLTLGERQLPMVPPPVDRCQAQVEMPGNIEQLLYEATRRSMLIPGVVKGCLRISTMGGGYGEKKVLEENLVRKIGII